MLEPQISPTPGDASWFAHDRFGLFVHWGLYSLAARHEWVQSIEAVHDKAYAKKYFEHFDPDLYNPEVWADAAADAGMKYFVVTTKHHEGFCLWDSKHTQFNARHTPYGKDVLRPMVEAFNARGLKTGFYHSLKDWAHPDYFVDYFSHPRRNELPPIAIKPDSQLVPPDGGGYTGQDVNAQRVQARYAEFMKNQVRELLTEFGPVAALWFDFSFVKYADQARDNFAFNKGREAWQSEALYAMIRELQPQVLMNDRLDLDLPLSGGDFKTPEQAQPWRWVHHEGQPVVWEACQTFSGSWGYARDEYDWRSVKQLITTLIDCVSKGGNLLLNVGPNGRGEIDARALDRLAGIGRWMRLHDRSIYGCTQAPEAFTCPQDCRLTYNPDKKRMYLHLFNWPYKFVHLFGKAWTEQVAYAQLLNDASECQGLDDWHAQFLNLPDDTLSLRLPQREPEGVEVPVIELFLK